MIVLIIIKSQLRNKRIDSCVGLLFHLIMSDLSSKYSHNKQSFTMQIEETLAAHFRLPKCRAHTNIKLNIVEHKFECV